MKLLNTLFRRAEDRRTVEYLKTLPDHLLWDIGVTRFDLAELGRTKTTRR